MPASRKTHVTVIGMAETLRAMQHWLKTKSRIPVKFQATKRHRPGAVVIRVDPE